eukprot:411741-Pelagomonas_calceolata.AAC.6
MYTWAKKHKDKGKKHKDKGKDKTDLVKQAKNYLKAHLRGEAAAPGQAPTPIDEKLRISEADYFAKNNEFTVWLQEELRLFYNDLNAEQTHDLFGKFVELWNSGRLAQKYYVGAVAAPARRTAHNWNFKVTPCAKSLSIAFQVAIKAPSFTPSTQYAIKPVTLCRGAGGTSAQEKGGMAAFLEDQKIKKSPASKQPSVLIKAGHLPSLQEDGGQGFREDRAAQTWQKNPYTMLEVSSLRAHKHVPAVPSCQPLSALA